MKFYTTSKISENMHETPEGYLVCTGVAIARTGEMPYAEGETPLEVGPDGKVVVSRSSDEVFRPETIASFEGKAVTILHPNDFVSPQNWSSLAKGILQNVRRGKGENENDLIADLLITDSVAINLVKNGLREVSCGYEAEYIQTGVGRGVQTNIIGNHLALVSEGRAGSAYAINDHKGKGSIMTLKDKIKAIFAKAQDDALKVAGEVADAGANVETPETKPGFVTMSDMKGYFDEKFAAMSPSPKKEEAKPKDASTEPEQNAPAEVVAKDDEPAPGASGLEARLAKLEAALEKLLAGKTGDDDGDGDDEVTDEDESCDDDMEEEETAMVGDSASDDDIASRVEILAPGMKAKGKDVKAKALTAAYATTDGKTVIHQFTGGKAPNLKDAATVNALFVATSELLKVNRNSDLSRTKTRDFSTTLGQPKGAMTPEQLNEINKKHYGGNRTAH